MIGRFKRWENCLFEMSCDNRTQGMNKVKMGGNLGVGKVDYLFGLFRFLHHHGATYLTTSLSHYFWQVRRRITAFDVFANHFILLYLQLSSVLDSFWNPNWGRSYQHFIQFKEIDNLLGIGFTTK